MRGCNAVALLCTCAILLSAWGAQAQVAWNQAGQFNYQLSEKFVIPDHIIPGVTVYFIDGFDNDATVIAQMKSRGLIPVCYVSAGTAENWRPDYQQFTAADKGKNMKDWEGEEWLNIRSDNVRRIMRERIQMCKDKGFLAVDPDNTDLYLQDGSYGVTATLADTKDYLQFLANTARSVGIGIGLKNTPGVVRDMVGQFDFAVNEACFNYNECTSWSPFIKAGKPVYQIQYEDPSTYVSTTCPKVPALGITSINKLKKLGHMPRWTCPQVQTPAPAPVPAPVAVAPVAVPAPVAVAPVAVPAPAVLPPVAPVVAVPVAPVALPATTVVVPPPSVPVVRAAPAPGMTAAGVPISTSPIRRRRPTRMPVPVAVPAVQQPQGGGMGSVWSDMVSWAPYNPRLSPGDVQASTPRAAPAPKTAAAAAVKTAARPQPAKPPAAVSKAPGTVAKPVAKPAPRPSPKPSPRPAPKPGVAPAAKKPAASTAGGRPVVRPPVIPVLPPNKVSLQSTPMAPAWAALTRPGLLFNYHMAPGFDLRTDVLPGVKVYFLNGWNVTAATLKALTGRGLLPVCSFSAGTAESWRSDFSRFNSTDLGAVVPGRPKERFLDVSSKRVRTVIRKRMEAFKAKGCLGLDPRNLNLHQRPTGLPVKAKEVRSYLSWLSRTAHQLDMGIGLNNLPDLVNANTTMMFDWAVTESCFAQQTANQQPMCSVYAPFKTAGKPIYSVEYTNPVEFRLRVCPQQRQYGVNSILKTKQLTAQPWSSCISPLAAALGLRW